MEPRFDASDATVARMMRSSCECARAYPASGMMTSDGIGMQADWIAMRRMTAGYPPLVMRPTRTSMSFSDMQVQYSGRKDALGCASIEVSGESTCRTPLRRPLKLHPQQQHTHPLLDVQQATMEQRRMIRRSRR